jgi:Telomere resolvase
LKEIAELGNSTNERVKAKELANEMKQAWKTYGMKELKQQRSLMTEVRGAIKQQLGKKHIALETMDFSREEWIEINRPIFEKAAIQNKHQVILEPVTVNGIVARATNLLMSCEWSEIAAGLVVLTGRRSTEVLKTAKRVFEKFQANKLSMRRMLAT